MVAPKLPADTVDPALYAQLTALPEYLIGEILGGELVVSRFPAPLQSVAKSSVAWALIGPFSLGRGGPGGWWILPGPEVHLGADVLVPEIMGFRRERLPRLSYAPVTIAPDWVLEVLSPTTGGLDRVRKMPRYAAAGVKHVWLVDPTQQTLEVYRLEGVHLALVQGFQGAALARAEPFDAIELNLADLWLPAEV